jgi:hypothetical protein
MPDLPVPVLKRRRARRSRTARRLRRWLRRAPWLLAGVAGLAVATLVWRQAALEAERQARPPWVPPGVSHDGIPLSRQHPLMASLPPDDEVPGEQVAAPRAAVSAPASAASVPRLPAAQGAAAHPAPAPRLAMRHGCAWGEPGRNPYRGTVEQALQAARLPPEVVRQVAHRVARRDVDDRVTITSTTIRRHASDDEYDAQRVALTFGSTMCVDSRVNFKPGHKEEGDLYQVADTQGRVHTVMVPDVCGNVSVLGARGERRRAQAAGGTREVGAPGTLAAVLAGLGAAWLARRRRPG